MSDPTGNVFLAVTTSDGKVHTTTRDAGTGTWSTFDTITPLNGRNNVAVSGSGGIIYSMDDNARRPHLWSTLDFGGWQPPDKDVLVGVAPVAAGVSNHTGLLAVGSTGLDYNLPLYVRESTRRPVLRADQLTVLDKGPLDTSDFPVELSMEGAFSHFDHSYELCIATESGALFHVSASSGTRSSFEDLKAKCGDPGTVKSVGCSTAGEGLQVCVVNQAGAIRHAYHNDFSGTWTSFGTVSAPSGTNFVRLAVKGFHGYDGSTDPILHLVGVTDTGGLMHAIRQTDGSWLSFTDVKTDAGDPGTVTSLYLDVNQYATP